MKAVFTEWKRNKKASLMLLTFMIMQLTYLGINAWIVKLITEIVNNPQQQGNNSLSMLIIGCAVTAILSALTGYFRDAPLHMVYTSSCNFYADKILNADAEMFTKFSCAKIQSVSEYIYTITKFGLRFVLFIIDIGSICINLISMWLLGGKVVYPIILLYIVGSLLMRVLFKKYDEIDSSSSKIRIGRNQELEDIINGFAEVRSFYTKEVHKKSIVDKNEQINNRKKVRSKINALINGAIDGVDGMGAILVALYCIDAISKGMIDQATAMGLVMYSFRIIYPLIDIVNFTSEMSESLALSKDWMEIISYKNNANKDGEIAISKFTDKIEIHNVSFAYGDTKNTLNNISMTFKKGQRIGICGASGCGKSTIFKLLNKFYVPGEGSIKIDGTNIWDVTNESYRRCIGSIHQENTIFPGSIKSNIIYGSPYASDYEVIEACKKANIYNFIKGLPEKFETEVGPRGLTLSGGQKQRIALARLFLRDPEIILMDEATSALDNESEALIQNAIDNLEGKTMITIAHRLSTIRNCDIIYVMGTNGIIEQGTHEELMALKGVYASMNK